MVTDVVVGENVVKSKKEHEKQYISFLINGILYYLGCAFIQKMDNNTQCPYRLVVIHHNRIYHDVYYKTVRGAKIAFQKRFSDRAWRDVVKAEWSHFYDPDKPWLENKLSLEHEH